MPGRVVPGYDRIFTVIVQLVGGKVAQPPRGYHTAMPRTNTMLVSDTSVFKHDLE